MIRPIRANSLSLFLQREEGDDELSEDLTNRLVWDIMEFIRRQDSTPISLAGFTDHGNPWHTDAKITNTSHAIDSLLDLLFAKDRQIQALEAKAAELTDALGVMVMSANKARRALAIYGVLSLVFSVLFGATLVTYLRWRLQGGTIPISPVALVLTGACFLGWAATFITGFRSYLRKLGK